MLTARYNVNVLLHEPAVFSPDKWLMGDGVCSYSGHKCKLLRLWALSPVNAEDKKKKTVHVYLLKANKGNKYTMKTKSQDSVTP